MNIKEFEEIIVNLNSRIKTEPQTVTLEVMIAQFMLLYDINENISLIRDMIKKKL